MTLKKTFKYLALLLVVATILLAFGANRDMTQIYGGLTEVVDADQFKPKTGPLLITNVNVLSADGETFIADQTVHLDNGLISSVSASSTVSNDARSINGAGKYLIPGLSDAHVHLFKSPNDLLLYLANGVTQIRELIGEPAHLKWRQEIQAGRLGPDMFIASPRIGSFDLLEGWFMSWSQGFLNINDASQAKHEVEELHRQGYDAVKIYSQINRETYFAVTKAAKDLGMKVVGHVPWSVQMSDLYGNQDSVVHLEELMNAINREFGGFTSKTAAEFLELVQQRSKVIAAELRQHDISVTTTLWLVESFVRQKFELETILKEVALEYENPGISEWTPRVPEGGLGWLPEVSRYQLSKGFSDSRKREIRTYWETYAKACQIILAKLVETKVTLMAGTDANLPPTVPGFSLHDEFISLNKAGMTPAQILRSSTSQPADWLDNNAGEISSGHKANLVLLDKNPLLDIANTKTINSVIVNGHLMDRALLDNMLNAVKQANDSSRKVDISEYL